MNSPRPLIGLQFEDLVRRILEANGFTFQNADAGGRDVGFAFTGKFFA